jgi:PTS system ascorbate-specific IIA component
MSVALLLITHGAIGEVLLQSAVEVLGVCPLPAAFLPAPLGCDPLLVLEKARKLAGKLDEGNGVLVLTDMFGATPSNIACRLRDQQDVRVVAGMNLPMLIRVLNYPRLSLDELTDKALSGGRDGVMICRQTEQCSGQ